MESYQYVLIAGNLSEGFRFFGPYLTLDDAACAADSLDEQTWVSTLEDPRRA